MSIVLFAADPKWIDLVTGSLDQPVERHSDWPAFARAASSSACALVVLDEYNSEEHARKLRALRSALPRTPIGLVLPPLFLPPSCL